MEDLLAYLRPYAPPWLLAVIAGLAITVTLATGIRALLREWSPKKSDAREQSSSLSGTVDLKIASASSERLPIDIGSIVSAILALVALFVVCTFISHTALSMFGQKVHIRELILSSLIVSALIFWGIKEGSGGGGEGCGPMVLALLLFNLAIYFSIRWLVTLYNSAMLSA